MEFDGSSLTINFHSGPKNPPITNNSPNLTNNSNESPNNKFNQTNQTNQNNQNDWNRKRKMSHKTTNTTSELKNLPLSNNKEPYNRGPNLTQHNNNNNQKNNNKSKNQDKIKSTSNNNNNNNNNTRQYRPLINAIKEAGQIVQKKKTNTNNINNKINDKLFDAKINLDGFEEIDEKLKNALKSYLKSNLLTVVQRLSWPTILKGGNTLIKSASGSGKTLAFLVPILDCLIKREPKINRHDGVFALILVPTKELAKQITDILTIICRNFIWIVPGGLYGCDRKKAEKSRLRKGLNVVVATPGRLHDHLVNTKCLDLSKLKWLVVDEADLLLDMGYEKKFQEIKECIPSNVMAGCQKICLSATLSKKFIDFFAQLFHENTAYFVDASKEVVTLEDNVANIASTTADDADCSSNLAGNSADFDYPINLKQLVIEIPTKLRLIALMWIIKYINLLKNGNNKNSDNSVRVIIFFSSMASADFHCQLFQSLQQHILSMEDSTFDNFKYLLLHGSMEIKERIRAYDVFSTHNQCILFTTDVASRGLDFPSVDWIIQFNPAREIKEYVHRVGRTCRAGNNGNAILFLEPHEMSYMDLLYKSHLAIEQLNIHTLYQKISKNVKNLETDATSLFTNIRKIVTKDELYPLALKAYNSTIRGYTSYPKALKQIFSLRNLHQGHLAESFAIREKPTDIGKHLTKERPFKSARRGPSSLFSSSNSRFAGKFNSRVGVPKKTTNSIRSASSLLLEEFQGGVVAGPSTRKSRK